MPETHALPSPIHPLRLIAAVVVAIAAAFPLAGQAGEYPTAPRPADAKEPPLGAYLCTVKNAVEIKGEKSKRVASVLKVPAKQQPFRIVLKDRDDPFVGNKACDENRPGKPAKPGTPPQFGSDHEWWYSCLSSYALELPKSRGGQKLRGDGRNLFLDQLVLFRFQLKDDLSYVFSYSALGGVNHLEEGQCRPEKEK